MSNFKSIALLLSKIWTIQVFNDHFKPVDGAFCLLGLRNVCAKFQVNSSLSFEDMEKASFLWLF